MEKVAFISGANRGIGFETAKKLAETGIKVILGSRDMDKGDQAIKKLLSLGINADLVEYNASDLSSPQNVFKYISDQYGKLDILINNVGVLLTGNLFVTNSSSISDDDLKETFQTNFFSVVSLTQALLPLIKKSVAGRIVNVSTILSSLTLHSAENSPISPAKELAYNASKTALNAYTVHLAVELKDTKIKVNSGHPGWVKTELGGPNAPVEVKDSYKTSLHLATLDDDGPTGGLFHEENIIPW
ncbi:MAG: short-chain dehydrogenase [Rickettsiales bacterium]|nr:short-chain dehydrogenase [Rickettsiales bacterium]OUV54510.1 MAG: short-chain dehydrogenase [Rickettsiales bacterium TMED127]|tara:strand:- start:72750 stop:73481 length:732 start_codon:yes stop_codon:yes gene_type:complete